MGQKPAASVQHVFIHKPRGNAWGVAGFVVSLAGFPLWCIGGGFLSVLGLLFSIVGLFKPPRGLAVAGFVLGLIGGILWVVVFLVAGTTSVLALLGMVPENAAHRQAEQKQVLPWQNGGIQPLQQSKQPEKGQEEQAQAQFDRAAQVSRNGQYGRSAEILRALIADYPNTKAAEKAKQILPGVERRAQEKAADGP